MHRGLRKPPRKDIGTFDRHTRGYVEDFREALMRKSKIPCQRGDGCISSKKSLDFGLKLPGSGRVMSSTSANFPGELERVTVNIIIELPNHDK
jgi:hypothetical protein